MKTQFICSNCGILLEIDESFAGDTVICKACRADVVVPVPDGYAANSEHSDIVTKQPMNYFPDFWQAVMLLFCSLILFIVTSLALYGLLKIISPGYSENHILYRISYLIVLIAIILYVSYRNNISVKEILAPGKVNFNTILIFIITILGFRLLFGSLLGVIGFLSPNAGAVISKLSPSYGTETATIIRVIIFTPILEEVLFRGIILKGFLKNYDPKKAIIIAAVLFGLLHGYPVQIISAGFAGILFGLVYYKTRSLISCIICHSVSNLSPALMRILREFSTPDPQFHIDDMTMLLFIISIFFVGCVMTYFGIRKFYKFFKE